LYAGINKSTRLKQKKRRQSQAHIMYEVAKAAVKSFM